MHKKIKLLIAEEHEIVRAGLCILFEETEEIDVAGTASDGYSAIKMCRNFKPDILIMDMALTRPSGTETFNKIRATSPDTKIILFSSNDETFNAFSMISNGAMGFLPKEAKGPDFVNAARAAQLDYVSIPGRFVDDFTAMKKKSEKTGNMYGLSQRELEVFHACTSGLKTCETAARLKISVRTVETHRSAIYRKTSCHSISELTQIAHTLE